MPAATASPEVSPLVSVLSREKAVYQALLEVASDEREAVIAGTLEGLKTTLQRKQELLERLATLEDRRISWLQRYARRHRLDMDSITLASIIAGTEGPDRDILGRVHRQLRQRIEQLVELNAITKALLDKVLATIDASLHFLLAEDASGLTYGSRGRLQPSASRQLLECQA